MRAHRKAQINTAIQHDRILSAIQAQRWRTTNGIADGVPCSVQTIWHRLRELERQGKVRSRRSSVPVRACEVHWRLRGGA